MISESELTAFANDPSNDIQHSECDKNVMKVFRRFGGVIVQGDAEFTANSIRTMHQHYWNVLKSDDGRQIQLIDIMNYKHDREGDYFNHQNGVETPIEEMERTAKQRKIDRETASRYLR